MRYMYYKLIFKILISMEECTNNGQSAALGLNNN